MVQEVGRGQGEGIKEVKQPCPVEFKVAEEY